MESIRSNSNGHNRTKIGNMDALLFTLILEVVLLQIRILEGTTDLRALQRKCTNQNQGEPQQDKLIRDRDMIKDILRRTLIELAESGGWRIFQEAVEILHERATSPVMMKLDQERLRLTRTKITNELKSKQNQWAIELRNADQRVAILRDKIRDDMVNANARLRYAEKWLFARAESLELRCQTQRVPAPRADHEQRVHTELLRAYELQIKEREDTLEYWRDKYTEDTTKMNERLALKCEQLRVTIARREELQKLYDLHEGEMRSWLTFKRERAARRAREDRLRKAATTIQAWWRGVMVRRALGPYRYLKNSKKPSNKNKKK